ncbi:hypothetical protein HBB16_00475 [Pseudonocardia sp. MCCB 268]|nr:hypothetical protein [Pseudonocardia cytotoxica]
MAPTGCLVEPAAAGGRVVGGVDHAGLLQREPLGVTQASLVTIGVFRVGADRAAVRAGDPARAAGSPPPSGWPRRSLAEYKVTTNDMLILLSLAVTDVLTAPTAIARRRLRQSLRQMTVGFAAEYVGPERSRSCLTGWRTTRDWRPDAVAACPARPQRRRGPADPADPAEAQVFALVDSLDSMIVTDVQRSHRAEIDIAEYRTFIAVTVAAGGASPGC